MAHDHSASTAWPDPRALATSLDAREAERLSGDDRLARWRLERQLPSETIRRALGRALVLSP